MENNYGDEEGCYVFFPTETFCLKVPQDVLGGILVFQKCSRIEIFLG